jgi:ADP-ribose pyrophosphatase YjhB (NUDIX family)
MQDGQVAASFLEELKRVKAIADTGLLYASSGYETERYQELQSIVFRMLHTLSGHSPEALRTVFPVQKDYPTPKVDVRAFILSNDQKILLVRESADGKWSLPGGWAEVGFTPAEMAIKEVKEETGLEVTAENLLAVFDKKKHPHPPATTYVYKLVIYCKPVSRELRKGFDILDTAYFSMDELPELSEERILKSQIALLYSKVVIADFKTVFD